MDTFVYTETTPNPLALKFILGQCIVEEGYYLFSSLKEAQGLGVVEDIFSLPGIESVLLTPHFMTVTKKERVPWPLLESIILSALQHHWQTFPLFISAAPSSPQEEWGNWVPPTPEIQEIFRDIQELVEGKIRPAIEADGGIITVCAFEKGVVYIKLQGSCSSCPHSQETLKGGIEQTLSYYIPEVKTVELTA